MVLLVETLNSHQLLQVAVAAVVMVAAECKVAYLELLVEVVVGLRLELLHLVVQVTYHLEVLCKDLVEVMQTGVGQITAPVVAVEQQLQVQMDHLLLAATVAQVLQMTLVVVHCFTQGAAAAQATLEDLLVRVVQVLAELDRALPQRREEMAQQIVVVVAEEV
jgi:hypothetical protein